MSETDQTIMGKKGEILPKHHLREISGIKPGDKISIRANLGELVITKILSIEEALALTVIAKHSSEEIEEIINIESRNQEELID